MRVHSVYAAQQAARVRDPQPATKPERAAAAPSNPPEERTEAVNRLLKMLEPKGQVIDIRA